MYMNLLQFYVYGVFVRRTSGHGVWLLDCVDRGQRPVSVSGSPWTETEAREPSKENTPATNSSRRSKSSDQTKLRERKRIGSRPTGDRNRYGGLMQQHCPEWPCQCCHHARREPATARRADPGSSYSTQSKHVLGGPATTRYWLVRPPAQLTQLLTVG